jgi:hypothetical protein
MSEQAANSAFSDLLGEVYTYNYINGYLVGATRNEYIPTKFYDEISRYNAINVATGAVAD